MGGVSNKTRSHILDLTYFSRSQRSKFEKNYESLRILLLFDLECSYLYIYTKFRPDRISNMPVRPGGHLGKST
jgi:hypothetical protein